MLRDEGTAGGRHDACMSAIELLSKGGMPKREQWRDIFEGRSARSEAYAAKLAAETRDRIYGKRVFVRGLIEFTNYCKNDCYYCGIRRSNKCAERYRLSEEEILECCRLGDSLGFKTFVLQGGEDAYFTDERLCGTVREIKKVCPGCAVTLSVGERSEESYIKLREAGADRYLLRHETANEEHYRKLHPEYQRLVCRKECLYNLKKAGFQTGAGMMIGSPGQTVECLIDDMEFLRELNPEMVGIGPFIPHKDTPFCNEPAGDGGLTLYILSLVRLMLPHVLLPATTALGTISESGRRAAVLAGANVIMPNLSPANVRDKYSLYNNKKHTGSEAAENLLELKKEMESISYEVVSDRGDYIP